VANFRSQHALTASSFPQSMIARLVLNLLKSRDHCSAAAIYHCSAAAIYSF